MSRESQFLLIGLQGAGKTTFLAALWHVVEAGKHPSALLLDRLDGNSRYLNTIRKDWLEFRKVPRTTQESERVVSMRLKSQQTAEKVVLNFPDLSGESFEQQWTDRQWKRTYKELLEAASGGLLFINPESVKSSVRIDEADSILAELEDISEQGEAAVSLPSQERGEEGAIDESVAWDKKRSPTQVQLVEILQFIEASRFQKGPFKIAVVISAWDRVGDQNLEPADWVARNLPLLSQFLKTNEGAFRFEFFGLSAQGGVYALDASQNQNVDSHPLDEPLADIDPTQRVKVVGNSVDDANDITTPIKWLMR